jgi:hypothetical protein
VLDPTQVAGFRRLAQALALRRLWGERVPIAAGAVFLREAAAEPGLVELAHEQFVAFERALEDVAGRMLRIELGDRIDDWVEPWPKLEHVDACGDCLHVGRCWKGLYEGESESPVLASEAPAPARADELEPDDRR